MNENRATFPLAAMCRVLGLSPSGYYDWLPTALAAPGSPLGRLWSPLDIAVSAVVDTARNGPLTVRHGDSGDPGFRASGSRAEGAIMAP